MKAAELQGDVDWALELHQSCLAGGKKTKGWFHCSTVKMLAAAGKLEEASAILQVCITIRFLCFRAFVSFISRIYSIHIDGGALMVVDTWRCARFFMSS